MSFFAFMTPADVHAAAAWKRGKGRSRASARRRAKRAAQRWAFNYLPMPLVKTRASVFMVRLPYHRVTLS